MDPPALPFTEAELHKAGLLGDGVPGLAAQVMETMKKHPELLNLSLFTLQCINLIGRQRKDPSSPRSPSPLTVSKYGPDEYERVSYYSGITGDCDDPELVYRSDFLTRPFSKPVGRFTCNPVKSLRGVFDTPLNSVWDTVGPEIRDLIKARKIHWSSIDPARIFTHGPPGEEAKGSLGPVVILALLLKNGVEDVVVEWREAVPQRLAGLPLMRHIDSINATHYVRRFLTPLLGVPLVAEEMGEDAQGTLTLWFHEIKDKDGNPSNKVYGVSNCHVLRENTTVDYEHRGGPRNYVSVSGMHRFQRGLDEIKDAIASHGIRADLRAREIVYLQAKETQDAENTRAIRANRRKLDNEKEAIADLEAFYNEVTKDWSDIRLHRNIGHVQHAPAITVDIEGGTLYTSDWAAFLAAETKVKDEFEGNVVDLGSKYSLPDLIRMFSPLRGGPTTFEFPVEEKLRIVGCASKEDLANPAEFDNEGQRCLFVGKDGNTTDLTVGRHAGLVSFTRNELGIESVELGIYNSGLKTAEVFSAKGDSGSLVWCTSHGEARIVGQLHSGHNKGGSTSNHVTYCTPGWYLLDQIRKRFKYADFYRTTWSA